MMAPNHKQHPPQEPEQKPNPNKIIQPGATRVDFSRRLQDICADHLL